MSLAANGLTQMFADLNASSVRQQRLPPFRAHGKQFKFVS